MELLRLLEGIRTPFLDSIFSLVTHLGSEAIFIAAAIIIFWCADKRKGYYLLSVGFLGIIINQFLKMLFRIPRPWVKDPEFTIVESARADADGYSFPSGHTQNAAAVLGAPARATEKKWLRILLVAGILLAGFSRMYLGVHTLADVAVSLLIGGVLIFGIYPLTLTWDEKPGRMYAFFGILSACAAALVVFMEVMAGVEGIDSHNLASGTKYAWLVFGAGLGLLAASFIERKYIGFKTSARFSVQLAKVVPGLALVMGLKAGLKPLCLALTGGHESATAIRYFLLVIFAVCIWPAAFRRIEKMNLKKALIITGCVILALALLAGFLFWRVTRETNAANPNRANPIVQTAA